MASRVRSAARFRLRRGTVWWIAVLLFCSPGCRSFTSSGPADAADPSAASGASPGGPSSSAAPVAFRSVAREAGIRFRLDNGARGKHRFIETTTGGCAFLDYNNDGNLDVFLIQAGPTPVATTPGTDRRPPPSRPPCALYRNNGDRTSTDVTRATGLDFDQGYAQAVAVADYDNDGWQDLLLTAYGGNHLLHNERGHFQEVTQRAGVADTARGPRWATSAAWADYDNDGHLDLFVCHYAHWTPEKDTPCNNPLGQSAYCSPDLYTPESPSLYRNNGNGTFSDVTEKAGLTRLRGRSLGVVWLDYDADGYEDIFVSNDLSANFLLHNNRDGTFSDRAIVAGVAVMDTGIPLAGMGIGVGDYDNDGRDDLLVTNFSNHPKVVYRAHDGRLFNNTTFSCGIGTTSQLVLGWGCEFFDYDLDGYRDVVIGNGHVNDDVESYSQGIRYREPKQIFHNRGDGNFDEDTAALGDMAEPSSTRGLAVGDYDNDGRPDVLANNHNMEAQLFHNEFRTRNGWITFRAVGTRSNRDGIGAKLRVRWAGRQQYAEVRSGSSYASRSDPRVTFGLGQADRIESVHVRWPSGKEETVKGLEARRFYVLTEGRGAARDPLIKERE